MFGNGIIDLVVIGGMVLFGVLRGGSDIVDSGKKSRTDRLTCGFTAGGGGVVCGGKTMSTGGLEL